MNKNALKKFIAMSAFFFIVISLIIVSGVESRNNELLLEKQLNLKQDPLDPYFKQIAAKKWVDDEIIIKFKDSVSTTRAHTILSSVSKKTEKLHTRQIYKVKLDNTTVEAALQKYKNDPNVEYVQPNYIYVLMATPDDPGFYMQWGLKNTGQKVEGTYTTNNPGCTGCDIRVEDVWGVSTDCSTVTIAVLDTGVNYIHEDLKNNMWDGRSNGFTKHGYNFVELSDDPMDYHGHGTHVAAIASAQGNNGVGISGVCWKGSIMAVKVLSDEGYGRTSAIVRGIYFAVDNGAKVINMSLGGGAFDYVFYDAVLYAKSKNVLVVAAAGNDGVALYSKSSMYPCMYGMYAADNVICVGALDQTETLASFTNYSKKDNIVHIYAPGVNILSAITSTRTVPITGNLINEANLQKTDNNWAIHNSLGYTVASNPANFDFTTSYKPNLYNSHLYTTVDCTGYNRVSLLYEAYIDTESAYDVFRVKYIAGQTIQNFNEVPVLFSISGKNNSFKVYNHHLKSCSNSLCTIAFQLETDSIVHYTGVALKYAAICNLAPVDNLYHVWHGTSMATPFVSGAAALVWAINPGFDYAKVKEKLLSGAKKQIMYGYGNSEYTIRKLNVWGALTVLMAPKNLRYERIK
ncbi:MAG: S8 family serine peptidase [Spirochaetota bacterium]